jgi:hypothetical protein
MTALSTRLGVRPEQLIYEAAHDRTWRGDVDSCETALEPRRKVFYPGSRVTRTAARAVWRLYG